ncbi:MAG: Na+/H+ antiporter NhaA [Actinomycetota bacterium]|nr:Na+/H+ antiporter NhaA [Actinomycetota bacterium]
MADGAPTGKTWLGSDTALARAVGRPVRHFLGIEAAGGILLLMATAVALVWANSPWSGSYHDLWHTEVHLAVGGVALEHHGHALTLHQLVNDALMAVFFFVVGLEIKRELVAGHLRDRRAAMLPAAAAMGGMVVPALLFFALNPSGDASAGWGIPMATDIAFAVGVVSILGPRVSTPLKVFLLSLAIVDDIGAILVIAVFYTSELATEWLVLAVATVLAVVILTRAKVWYTPFYLLLGTLLWYATFRSGIHATIAGVAMGLLAPAKALLEPGEEPPIEVGRMDAHNLRAAKFRLNESVSVAARLEHQLHPVTSFVIIPVFALANAGIELSGEALSDALTSPITLGVVLGLVVGKVVGISLFTLGAVRFGLSALPRGATVRHVVGLSAIAGIGFTVSLFVTGLAYDDLVLQDEAKVGILFASVVAALVGLAVLSGAHSDGTEDQEIVPEVAADHRTDGSVEEAAT